MQSGDLENRQTIPLTAQLISSNTHYVRMCGNNRKMGKFLKKIFVVENVPTPLDKIKTTFVAAYLSKM